MTPRELGEAYDPRVISAAQRGDRDALALIDESCDWRLMRRVGVGGSDVAAIIGLDPYKSALDVWLDKRGEAREEPESEPQRFGKLLEPAIASEYERRERVMLVGPFDTAIHRERPWQVYSPDRAVMDARGKPLRVVELKARGFWRTRDYGPEGTDEVPAPELCQVAWYMSALNVERADIAALFNTHSLRIYRVDRDRELEASLLERVDAWWRRYVVAGETPPPDGTDSYTRHLRERHRATLGSYVSPNPELARTIKQLRMVEAIRRDMDATRETLRQEIMAAIGEHDGVELPEGRLTWRPIKGRVSTSDVISALAERAGVGPRELAALQEKHRGEASRMFRVPLAWRGDAMPASDAEFFARLKEPQDG